MVQLSVGNTMPGIQRGQLVGPENRQVTRFNARSETRTITVTYDAAGVYYVTVTGIPYNGGLQQSVTVGPIAGVTSDALTAQAILAAIAASGAANSIVSVTRAAGVLTVTSRRAGGLTVSAQASGGSAAAVVASTGAEAPLEAGVMVVKDTTSGDKCVRQPAAGVVDVDGITLWPKIDAGYALTGNAVWPAKFEVQVLRRGVIGVLVDGTVTPASVVYFRHAASGANTTLGAFRADTDSGNATIVPNGSAKFLTSGVAGDVVQLEISLP